MNKLITIVFLLIGSYGLSQNIYYVDPGATSGTNDGSSWANAYTDIVDAVGDAVVVGNVDVWVKKGLYVAPVSGDYAFLTVTNGVHLYGGFDGTETNPNQRDLQNNVTTLSGDVDEDDFPFNTINDALFHTSRSDNVFSIIVARPSNNTNHRGLKVDGFTISDGNASSSTAIYGYRYGGGIYIDPSTGGQTTGLNTIEIENCIFENNSAHYGSAILAETAHSRPVLTVIENSIFRNNYSTGNVVYSYANEHASGMLITNCLFTDNKVNHNIAGLISSGSENALVPSIVNVINSTFADNSVASGNVATIGAPSVPNGDTIPAQLNIYNTIINESSTNNLIEINGGGVADTIMVYGNIVNHSQLNFAGNFAHINTTNNLTGQNPGFIGNGNYQLSAGSPALSHSLLSDYLLWYNSPTIPFTAPTTGLGGNMIPTSGNNMSTGAYQGVGVVTLPEIKQPVISTYPNPTSGQLTIQVEKTMNIRIINMQGQILSQYQLNEGNNFIDISHLETGAYILQNESGEGTKLIKE